MPNEGSLLLYQSRLFHVVLLARVSANVRVTLDVASAKVPLLDRNQPERQGGVTTETQFKRQHRWRAVLPRLFVIPPSADHSRHPQIPLCNQRKASARKVLLSLSLAGKFRCRVRVPRGIAKTLEAAYLLKTGGQERVKKASQPSVFFHPDGPDLPRPPELGALPEVPPNADNLSALIHSKPGAASNS